MDSRTVLNSCHVFEALELLASPRDQAILITLNLTGSCMFIPIGDDNTRRQRFPFVVYLLIALNAYVWFLELQNGEEFIAMYAAVPFEIIHGVDLVTTQHLTIHGEDIPIVQAPGPSPIYLTLLTSMFMHASWMHIIGNMVYLLIFGDQIEDRLGHFKFLAFYLVAGTVAALAQIVTAPDSILPTLGASGAIAGVLGAYLILYPRNPVRVLLFNTVMALPAYSVLGLWILMQVLGHLGSIGAQAPGVAYMAHIGGFAVGFVVTWFINSRSPRRAVRYMSR